MTCLVSELAGDRILRDQLQPPRRRKNSSPAVWGGSRSAEPPAPLRPCCAAFISNQCACSCFCQEYCSCYLIPQLLSSSPSLASFLPNSLQCKWSSSLIAQLPAFVIVSHHHAACCHFAYFPTRLGNPWGCELILVLCRTPKALTFT